MFYEISPKDYETSERKWVKYEIEKAMELLWAVTIEKARCVMKLTATGIVSDFHRCSLFILGDWCYLKHLNPKVKKYRLILRYQKK